MAVATQLEVFRCSAGPPRCCVELPVHLLSLLIRTLPSYQALLATSFRASELHFCALTCDCLRRDIVRVALRHRSGHGRCDARRGEAKPSVNLGWWRTRGLRFLFCSRFRPSSFFQPLHSILAFVSQNRGGWMHKLSQRMRSWLHAHTSNVRTLD